MKKDNQSLEDNYYSDNYNYLATEKKWQEIWQKNKVFNTLDDSKLPKYYVLEMFPYPSGKIHMGHVRNYAIGDVLSRYKKAKGFNVLHPMGWDSFGLPAENAAKEQKTNPKDWTYSNIDSMRGDLKRIGLSIDWSREIITSDPDYYKHEQKMFIDFYNIGLAYKKETLVNWDPVEQTVLANEQVINGKGWRSGAEVEQKSLSQWFLKITDFAEDLLQELDNLKKWPPQVVTMQRNWIGKSEGALLNFKLTKKAGSISTIEVFTTRPETIYGASFVAISKEHSLSTLLAKDNAEIDNFIKELEAEQKTNTENKELTKKGINTSILVEHPFIEKKKLPVFIANFVLNSYGEGAIFGVPAHDARDFEFAKIYNLPLTTVVAPKDNLDFEVTSEPFTEHGIIKNSNNLNGLTTVEAKKRIIDCLQKLGLGKSKINYKLRDWGVSRQRYWGCPIPIVYCENCGLVPENIENLPITLPENIDFSSVKGNPLESHPTWKFTKCPKCNKDAIRETDTFDTFVESSWYFLKYTTENTNIPFSKELVDYWLPVDQYIGGIEHAILHLLYARFFVKALNKANYYNNLLEPFKALTTQGMICHKTYKTVSGNWVFPDNVIKSENGNLIDKYTNEFVVQGNSEKMSKSKKNVVSPDYICNTYGADAARLFVLSDAPPTKDLEWSEEGIEGIWKFINRVWKFSHEVIDVPYADTFNIEELSESNKSLLKFTHKMIKETENNIEILLLNKSIANIRELFNLILTTFRQDTNSLVVKYSFCILIRLINPFVPHLSEEIWQMFKFKNILALTLWPTYNKTLLVENNIVIAVQISGKTRGQLTVTNDITEEDLLTLIKKTPNLIKFIENKPIKKTIYVKGKIINIVV